MSILLGLLLILIGVLALALQRLYSCVPAYELKRLAARGDHLAATLFRPVSYGSSLRLLLWTVFGIFFASGLLLVAYNAAPQLSFVVVALSLAAIVWLLSARLTSRSVRLAAWASPLLNVLVQRLHRPLDAAARLVNRYRKRADHSGLYEKEDILRLLRRQRQQNDNRVSEYVLDAIEHAARLDDFKAADVVQPWSEVKYVRADESIGPVLLGELHDSGQKMFAVYKDSPGNVVGALSLHDASMAKSGGRVRDFMKPNICFAHEDFSLRQVLDVFASSGHLMVVVVNQFDEAIGVITLRHVLDKLIGQGEQTDVSFEDRKAVASWRPQLAEVPVTDEPQDMPSPEPTEVVE